MNLSNWAGSFEFSAERLHTPKTVLELQTLVKECDNLKVIGTRHSFSRIADCSSDLVSLEQFNFIGEPDSQSMTVTVGGGVRYGELCEVLDQHGFAIPNLASLPHISIAGACATATHGSGVGNGNLATIVCGLEFVNGLGEIVSLTHEKDDEEFLGTVVGLGALGIVTQLTLRIIPRFMVQQEVYENLPLAALESHFEEIVASAYSVSLFTNWQGNGFNQIWRKRLDVGDYAPSAQLFEATLAAEKLHPVPGMSAINCTEQLGVSGPWHERLAHFRMDFTPSSGAELQSEYFVAREYAFEALMALDQIRESIAPVLQISEVRTIAPDELWMSPCYQRASVAFHFTWLRDWHSVEKALLLIEEKLRPFNARPHWGKLFTMSGSDVQSQLPRMSDFQKLVKKHDPERKFRNDFLQNFVYAV